MALFVRALNEGERPYFRLVKYCNLPRYIYIYNVAYKPTGIY